MQIVPDNAANLDWVHCLGWRLRNNFQDPWTAFVVKVKGREPLSVKNAAECMAIYVKSLPLKHKHIYVVPIISSRDKQACADDPSTVFSQAVARAVGGICVVDALEKRPYSSLHSGRKSASERDSLVFGTYTCTGFNFPRNCRQPLILIVDDIITRGSTMNDAARAIKAKHEDLLIGGLALAKWQAYDQTATNCDIPDNILEASRNVFTDYSVAAKCRKSWYQVVRWICLLLVGIVFAAAILVYMRLDDFTNVLNWVMEKLQQNST